MLPSPRATKNSWLVASALVRRDRIQADEVAAEGGASGRPFAIQLLAEIQRISSLPVWSRNWLENCDRGFG